MSQDLPKSAIEQPRWPLWLRAVLFSLAYFLCAEAGGYLSARGATYVSFWLPAGLYVAVLLMNERRDWPWFVLAALPSNLAFDLISRQTSVTPILCFFAANTLQSVLGAWLVQRFITRRPTLRTLREFIGLLGFSAVLSAAVGAAVGAATLVYFGLTSSFVDSWQLWWGSTAMAILILTPFILTRFASDGLNTLHRHPPKRWVESSALLIVTLALTWQVMFVEQGINSPNKGPILLPVLWAGLRFGPRGAATLNLFVALLITFCTTQLSAGLSPEQIASGDYVLTLQITLAVMALVGMIPAVVLGERKRAEAEIEALNQRLSVATRSGGIGIWDWDVERNVLVWDDEMYRVFQVRKEQFGGAYEAWSQTLHPEDREQAQAEVEAALRKHKRFDTEFRIVWPGGEVRTIKAAAQTFYDADGRPQRMVGINFDITDRKQAEQALRASEESLRATIENTPHVAVQWYDADGRVMFWNRASEMVFGWTAAEAVGLTLDQLIFEPGTQGQFRNLLGEIGRTGRSAGPLEFPFNRRDGSKGVCLSTVFRIPLPNGESRFVCMDVDLTERKRAEELTETQRRVLEMIANGKPLRETLAVLLRMIEAQATDLVCSVLLMDEDGVHIRHGAAPSLPAEFLSAIDGSPIGPQAGSCGTAAFRREAVIVSDIATDPLWQNFKHLALPHGLRACWSTPILDERGNVLGTFAIYQRQPGRPHEQHHHLISVVTHTAAVCIAKHRADEALRLSEEKFAKAFQASPSSLVITRESDGLILEANESFAQRHCMSRTAAIGKSVFELGVWQDAEERRRLVEQLNVEGAVRGVENVTVLPSGRRSTSLLSVERLRLRGEDCLLTVSHDVTELKEAEQALRRSEELFRAVVQDQTEMIVRWKPDGTRTFVNQAYCRAFGGRPESFVGSSFYPLISEADREDVRRRIQLLTPSNPLSTATHRSLAPTGDYSWQEWTDRGIFDAQGQLVELQSTGRDISERMKAEAALRDSEQRFRSYFELPMVGLAITSLDKGFLEVNDQFCETLGYSREELTRKRWSELTFPADLYSDLGHFQAVLAGELDDYSVEKRFVRKDSQVIHAAVSVRCVRRADGSPDYFIGMLQDITRRKHAEESLRQVQARELKAREVFARQLLTAQERERKRLAAELHDGLGQSLSLIKNRARLAQEGGLTESAAKHLEAITRIVGDAITEVRGLVNNLRPIHIEHIGLTDSLEALIAEVVEASGIPIERRLERVDDLFKEDQASGVFRILQEALNNLVKHSGATRACVTLERDIRSVRLMVMDDGRGFDLREAISQGGLGLTSLNERARMLHGTFQITSASGQGTKLVVELPTEEGEGI